MAPAIPPLAHHPNAELTWPQNPGPKAKNAARRLECASETAAGCLRTQTVMTRKSIPTNTARDLWAQCGGFCQNPTCNMPLFASIGDTKVSLANVAHIIGHGADGPRSDHELADAIDKDGMSNLIMLCLVCHKVVDELESKFSVETMRGWKREHARKISSLFQIPDITDETVILNEVNNLLETNGAIFRACGPFSESVIDGASGDGLLLWHKRCLDTILPNNQRIVQLIHRNRKNFPITWDVYSEMVKFKVHVDAFQDNCLADRKVSDYKTFPAEFVNFVRRKLGIEISSSAEDREDKVDYRFGQLRKIIERFLSGHDLIESLEQVNLATMLVRLQGGRTLKVFVTCSYFFTDYTFDKVMELDPSVDAIINSHPAGSYTESAKQLCMGNGIGLFTLAEFMGAVRKTGADYLNYLLRSESNSRLESVKRQLKKLKLPPDLKIYLFGSYLRRKVYRDVDMMIVHPKLSDEYDLRAIESSFHAAFEHEGKPLDLSVASSSEFACMRFEHNNLKQIHP